MMKNKAFQKVFSKNYLKMSALFLVDPDLLMPGILDIRIKFGIDSNLPVINPVEDKDHWNEFIKQGSQKMRDFHKMIGARLFDFNEDLGKIRKQLHLGKEWNIPLEKFVVSGIFLPPPFSVFVSENENNKTITFELNKNTTRDDLDLAWKNIKDIRKKMFGKIRANFPTKKTLDNFVKLTEYKTVARKDQSAVDSANNDREYKKRSIDIIGEIYSSENDISEKADKKRLNKLKVAKHRFKKVTS